MAKKQWVFLHQTDSAVAVLAAELRVPRLVARMLLNRGVVSAAEGERFLRPRPEHLHDPFLFGGMKAATARIAGALSRREHIRVFGDYDVDGTSATALLTGLFRALGAVHSHAIPARGDGYGLSLSMIERAAADGVKVGITVDNGIASHVEAARARELGIDLIITDHHTLPGELPAAAAIIHPKLAGQEYPFRDLCGAGLAFKLAHGVIEHLQRAGGLNGAGAAMPEVMADALAFAALATVCDVVPLVGENRVIASLGLQALEATKHPGLRALCSVSGAKAPFDAQDIGFKFGPRINAASRMGEDRLGIDLFTATDAVEAESLALRLDALNRQRQTVERKATGLAKEAVEAGGCGSKDGVLVVAGGEYPPGIAGIIAARLVDTYHCPAVVMGVDADGTAKGSGRSTRSFNLHSALTAHAHLMERFGGHMVAVGMTMRADRVAELRAALNADCGKHTAFVGRPELKVDGLVGQGELTEALARSVLQIGPFGEGNHEPVFVMEGAQMVGRPKLLGKTARHVSFQVRHADGGGGMRAVGFGMADLMPQLEAARTLDVAFQPVLNDWGGMETVEMRVSDISCG